MKKTKIPSLKSLIEKGKFDYVDSNITEKLFPAPKTLRTDYRLFHFDRYISSEDAVKEMQKEGYEPTNIYELLSWSDWNKQDWVIALSSVGEADGNRRVPYLFRFDSERDLRLSWWGIGWRANVRFLGVRNLSSDSRKLEVGHSDTLTLEKRIEKIEAWIDAWETYDSGWNKYREQAKALITKELLK